jgi:mannose/fructose/N-acetylgalactosamine-specific phosphotransferase system component IIB
MKKKPKMRVFTPDEVKESLLNQLKENGNYSIVTASLVDDYIFYYIEEIKMQLDIVERGKTYKTISAAGKTYEKENPNVKNSILFNKQKQHILNDLGLNINKCVKFDEDL